MIVPGEHSVGSGFSVAAYAARGSSCRHGSGAAPGRFRCLRLLLVALVLLLTMAGPALYAGPPRPGGGAIVENRGQWNPLARFMAERGGLRLWFADGGVTYDLDDGAGAGHRLRQRFVGASASSPVALRRLPGIWSFLQRDRSVSGPSASAFAELRYDDLYPGIDARYYDSAGSLKYDLLVAPGADPSLIRMRYEGAGPAGIAEDGSLMIATSAGTLREAPPYCYQRIEGEHRRVECRFVMAGEEIGFALGAYDRSLPLVIDPTLVYSSYLGGARADAGRGITLDSTGNIYVTGETISADFPTTLGAYRRTLDAQTGRTDIFVAKLDPTGSTLIYATYIGGGDADLPSAIRVRSDGTAIIAGSTRSLNLPVNDTAYSRSLKGGWDGFVLGLNSTGNRITFCSYLGGAGDDQIEDLTLDAGGAIYVAGWTRSADFPQSGVGGYRGGEDAFLAKLSSGARRLVYSTILGGTGDERAVGVVERDGSAWITGWTTSVNDFPTRNPLQANNEGDRDGFIARIRFDGSSLDYGTLLGGSGADEPSGIALDSSGNVYITGSTRSTDYPNTSGSAIGSWFLTKILWQSFIAIIDYSRYIGADDGGGGRAIQVDRRGNIYIAGVTNAAEAFPTTADGVADAARGGFDIGMVGLSPTGAIVHASVIGGSADEGVRPQSYISMYGDMFITGSTLSADLPMRRGSYDSTLNEAGIASASDAFVMRFNYQRRPAIFAQVNHIIDTLGCEDSARYEFDVYNVGDSDLLITSKIFGESPFKLIPVDATDSSGVPVVVVPPGGSKRYKVLVAFTNDRQGVLTDSLRIFSNDSLAGRTPFIIRFTIVRIKPILIASPPPPVRLLSCGSDSLDFRVTLVNTGFGPFTLNPVIFARGGRAFRVVDPQIPPGGRLVSDQSIVLTLRFAPKRGGIGSDGVYRDTILVDAAESKSCVPTLRIPLEGRVDSVVINVLDTVVSVRPLFACETSATAYVRLINRSSVPVTIDSALGEGFSLLTPLPRALPAGAVDSLLIAVAPALPGTYRSTIILRYNPCGGSVAVPLEVRRLPAELLSASSSAIDLGLVQGCAGVATQADTVITLLRDPSRWEGDLTLQPLIPPEGFSLPDNIAAPVTLGSADTLRVTVRYAPAVSGTSGGVLLIPYRAGPCFDTLRIALAAARADLLVDLHPAAITLPDLLACDPTRDTSVTVVNRSLFPVTITGYRSTEGISRVSQHPFSPVAPGDSFTVTVTLTPKRSGAILDSLLFYIDPCGDSLLAVFRGNKEGAVIVLDRDSIGFAPLFVCELPDTIFSDLVIRNTGSSGTVTVQSVRIIGDPAYTISGGIVGRTIGAGEMLTAAVGFAPPGEGTFSAMLEVVVAPCNDTIRARLAGEAGRGSLTVSGGDFGGVALGKMGRAELVVRNRSSKPVSIDTLVNLVPPFTLAAGGSPLPVTLAPGDSVVLVLEFAPRAGGIYQPTLALISRTPCLDSTVAQLFGEGIASATTAELCIAGRYSGISGDTIAIPLLSSTPGVISGPVDIIYSIGYDWRRLVFLGVEGMALEMLDTARPGPLLRFRQRGAMELLPEQFRLRFRLLSGGESEATVRLDSVTASSPDLAIAVCADSAIVRISDRCVFTGVALGKFRNMLEDIHPNPAAAAVELTYQQLEDARAVLRIHDATGRELLRPLDAELPGGRYTVRFYVGDLPSGLYFYSVEAGSYRETRKMLIER